MNIKVDSLYFVETYAGVYAGAAHGPGSIEWAKESADSRIEKLWGAGRPIHHVEPTLNADGYLPRYRYIAWLVEREPDRHLVVVWWSDEGLFEQTTSLLDGRAGDVASFWEQRAEAFKD